MISGYQAVTEFGGKKHTLRLSSLFLPQVWEGGVRTPAFVHYPGLNNTGCFGSYKIGNWWKSWGQLQYDGDGAMLVWSPSENYQWHNWLEWQPTFNGDVKVQRSQMWWEYSVQCKLWHQGSFARPGSCDRLAAHPSLCCWPWSRATWKGRVMVRARWFSTFF